MGIPAELKHRATDARYDRARYGLGCSSADTVRRCPDPFAAALRAARAAVDPAGILNPGVPV